MILLVVDTQKLIMTDAMYNFEQFKSNVSNLINEARSNDIEVIYVCHNDGEGSVLTPGTEGFEVYEDFKPLKDDKMFVKVYNSAFKATELDLYLKSKDIKDIAICGLQTDLCIDATVKSGFELGYNMYVVEGCNSTEDNEYINREVAVNYYNQFIWKDRYATIISIDELSTI